MQRRFLAVLILLAYCTHSYAEEASDPELIVYFQYALYLLPDSKGDPLATAQDLLQKDDSVFQVQAQFNGPPPAPAVVLTLEKSARERYVPPDLEFIGYFGRGVSRQQALDLQETDTVLIVEFAYPNPETYDAYAAATRLLNDVAEQHGGLIWDDATRELFAPAAWKSQRVDTWQDGTPSAADHVTIHAYKNTDYVRAITLGMQKFGQPDIVVNDFPWSSNRPVGNLVNLVAQSLVEGATFDTGFTLTLDASRIRHTKVREELLESMHSNTSEAMTFEFRAAQHEEGDPDNFLVEILFDSGEGETVQERQETILAELFGWEDNVSYVSHDEKILAASLAAKQKMPQLRDAFNKGLEPGEYIHVKAPFERDDGGSEWMWVEVMEWDGTAIRGLLMNEPYHVPELRAGSEVTVSQDDIFDYIRSYADGTVEGNETGRLIMEAQAQ